MPTRFASASAVCNSALLTSDASCSTIRNSVPTAFTSDLWQQECNDNLDYSEVESTQVEDSEYFGTGCYFRFDEDVIDAAKMADDANKIEDNLCLELPPLGEGRWEAVARVEGCAEGRPEAVNVQRQVGGGDEGDGEGSGAGFDVCFADQRSPDIIPVMGTFYLCSLHLFMFLTSVMYCRIG